MGGSKSKCWQRSCSVQIRNNLTTLATRARTVLIQGDCCVSPLHSEETQLRYEQDSKGYAAIDD